MNLGYYLGPTGWLVFYLLVSWLIVDLFHVKGEMAWMLRSFLAALGFVAYGLVFWYQNKRRAAKAAAPAGPAAVAPAGPATAADLDYLLKEAESRLASSHLGRDARLTRLPVIFVAGQTGSAKTSTVTQSGIEPELLSGQVWQEGLIVPTRATNVWFARQTVFVEAGGGLTADAGRWAALVKRLQPGRLRSIFARRQQATRAAVLCVDAEAFLKPGARESVAVLARALNSRLSEIANLLAINVPVYVLFTRMDRVSFFAEYVRNLTEEEARQVVGATLPIVLGNRGVYAEEETKRLSEAFTDLQLSLCDKRPLFLARENDSSKLPGIYEFPREFRKLRTAMVQFLVDVCRPSQLRASPFLRGFYFSGVRPVEVRDNAPALQARARSGAAGRATGIFSFGAAETTELPAASPGVRRVPQWVFLSHLFNDVILADRPALSASGHSARTDLMRRILFAGVAVVALAVATCFTVSYMRNRALEARVFDAARGISSAQASPEELPPIESLERLETLRESLGTLAEYHRDGPPWSLRWGLYTGDSMYHAVHRLYFGRFHALLFGSAQAAMHAWMDRLPATPGPTDDYSTAYNTLRGYLITTSNHDKSTRAFLAPLLYTYWQGSRTVDPDRARLIGQQFDFYSDELRYENPFSVENDPRTVAHTRDYLAHFAALQRIYHALLVEASGHAQTVNFNRQVPGSAQAVINNRDVEGAFTKDGWAYMTEAIRGHKHNLGGEEWVLGPQAYTAVDPAQLAPQLEARYHSDYVAHWRAYVSSSSIVRYASLADAARKLGMLSNNQSYLLQLFCIGAVNTNMASDDAKAPFQPLQFMTPAPGCSDKLIADANKPYVDALINLQSSIDRASRATGPTDPVISQTQNDATAALQTTRQVANNFRPDRDGGVDRMTLKLMEDPITYAQALLGNIGPGQMNGQGRNFCAAFNGITNKYPFNTASRVDVTLDELGSILRPNDGLLWTFYENNLKTYLVRAGSQYVPAAGSSVRLTPQFVRFFNRAAALSAALYPNGAREPHLTYSMKALPSEGLRTLTLTLDGATLKSTGAGGQSMEFAWPGASAHDARLSGPDLSYETWDGLWAVFHFFGDADHYQPSGAGFNFEWVPRTGQSNQPMMLPTGKPLTISYFLDMNGAPPIFEKNYLAGYQCVSRIAE